MPHHRPTPTIGPGQRPLIAARWHIDSADTLRRGWPEPGTEPDQIAVGWVPAAAGFGVIEWSGEPVSERMLEILERHFPGRRWVSAREDAWCGAGLTRAA